MNSEESEAMSAMRAVAHPLRLQMLSLLTGTAMSAAEVARELGVSQANASYHLRLLAAAELLEEAGEEKIRGGIAKRYRHPWRAEGRKGPRSSSDFRLSVQAVTQELIRRSEHRRPRTKSFLSDAEMWVPPDVWAEVLALLTEASQLIHESALPPRTKGSVHVTATTVAFQMRATPAEETR